MTSSLSILLQRWKENASRGFEISAVGTKAKVSLAQKLQCLGGFKVLSLPIPSTCVRLRKGQGQGAVEMKEAFKRE
jgi:hypothetical protein